MSRAVARKLPDFVPSADAFEAELDYLYRTFLRLGARPAEAEELVQDVFLVMCRRWSDYAPGRPLRPWLAGIAHNIARDHFRRHWRREMATPEIDLVDERPGPEDQLASAQARHLALQALALLPETRRRILVRHDLDGVSIREIAEELSLRMYTAATRLRRARLQFGKIVRQLQQQQAARQVLPAVAVLAAERSIPAMPQLARARLCARLRQPTLLSRPAQPTTAAGSPSRWLLLPVAAALVAAALIVATRAGSAGPIETTDNRTPETTANTLAHAVRKAPARPLLLSGPALIPPPQPAQIQAVAPRPLAHWRFEDGRGSTTAADSSGNGHPCLLHALDPEAAWVPGRVGGALDLGAAGWLECPLPEVRPGAIDLSVAIWMKRVRWERPEAVLFARQLPSLDRQHLFWFGMREGQATVWSGSWRGWTIAQPRWREGWTHLAFVHTGRETRLYVDGVLAEQGRYHPPRPESHGVVRGPLTIGATRFNADPLRVRHHFDGLVDEAVVYDRALTDTQIAALARPPE